MTKSQGLFLLVGLLVGMAPGFLSQAKAAPADEELAICLEPIRDATMPGALLAVERLTELATNQSGEDRAFTVKIAQLVKNLFRAEHQIATVAANEADVEKRAQQKEAKAEGWLRPNSFGTIRKDLYVNDRRVANEMRTQYRDALVAARSQLAITVSQTESALAQFKEEGRTALVPSIQAALEIIASRSLGLDGPDSLTRAEFHQQLFAIALLGFAAASIASQGPPTEMDPEKANQEQWDALQAQIQKNHREFRRQNFLAEQRGEPHPYGGFGAEP